MGTLHTRIAAAGVAAACLAAGTAAAAGDPRTVAVDGASVAETGLRPLTTLAPLTARIAPADVSSTFLDAPFDGQAGLAPDLRAITMSHRTADDHLVVTTVLDTNLLIDGDVLFWSLDTDGNSATGDPVLGGADREVLVIGQIGTDLIGSATWDGTTWVTSPLPALTGGTLGLDTVRWEVPLADIGVGRGQRIGFMAATEWQGIFANYFDFAPEVGLAPFSFTTEAPPPPPPPPAPVPVAAPPAPVVAEGSPAAPVARRLAIRGVSARRTPAGVRLSVSWAGGQGPVFWTVVLAQGPRTKTVSGHGPSGARTVTRLVRLPRTWTAAPVRADISVEDDADVLVRTRRLR